MNTEDGTRRAVQGWLQAALGDAERRGLPELKPLLESLAEATLALRTADWADDAAAVGETDAKGGGR